MTRDRRDIRKICITWQFPIIILCLQLFPCKNLILGDLKTDYGLSEAAQLTQNQKLAALYRKSDLCIPRNETAWPHSEFLHSCICEGLVNFQDPSAYSKKFETALTVHIIRGLGETYHEKNQKLKISWHCPFKNGFTSLKFRWAPCVLLY
jgi:hypothetical protein